MENNELYHWGILGMKWGVRRYQNKDGTLTPAGKRRLEQSENKKTIKDLTDDELRAKYNRLRLESDYKKLYAEMNPQKKSFVKKMVDDYKDKIIKETSDLVIKKAKDYMEKRLGLNTADPMIALRKEIEYLRLNSDKERLSNTEKNRLQTEYDIKSLKKRIYDLDHPSEKGSTSGVSKEDVEKLIERLDDLESRL